MMGGNAIIISFLLLFLVSLSFSKPSMIYRGCNAGIIVRHDTNFFEIKSSSDKQSRQINCLIQPLDASNAFLTFDLIEDDAQPILNSTSEAEQLHVSVTDEVGELLMRKDVLLSVNRSLMRYPLQVCPSYHFSEQTRYRIRILGNVNFRIQGNLAERLIRGTTEFVLRPQDPFHIQAFTIPAEDVYNHVYNVTVSSDGGCDCVLTVSQGCLQVQQNKYVQYSTHAAIKLTFQKYGRITLSQSSSPSVSPGHWFVGIYPVNQSSCTENKTVTLSADPGTKYQFLPILFLLLVSLALGVLIAVFSHFFLNRDIDLRNIDCKKCLKCRRETAEYVEGRPAKELFVSAQIPVIDVCEEHMVPEDQERYCPPVKRWFKIIIRRWFGKGEKTFSYTTGIVCITLLIGTIQFLIANWNDMIDDGNRDICFYNEACYHPPREADIPLNLIISNLPYITNGLILAISMSVREASLMDLRHAPVPFEEERDMSIAYALTWALIFEGLFSGFYHLCPSSLTFQFDSAFMFVMSGLVIVALFNEHLRKCRCDGIGDSQDSHKPIKAPKYFLFFVCPILMLNYIGALQYTRGLSHFADAIFYILLILWLFGIYYWVGYRLEIFNWRNITCSSLVVCKICMMYVLMPAAIISMGILSYPDWSSFFLFTSIIASGLAILASIITDIIKGYGKYHERVGRGQISYFLKRITSIVVVMRVLFVFALTACWCLAIYNFAFISVTDKTLSPSESRNLNKPCQVWMFFDNHDLWHFWSAFGLLMGTYLLLYYA